MRRKGGETAQEGREIKQEEEVGKAVRSERGEIPRDRRRNDVRRERGDMT